MSTLRSFAQAVLDIANLYAFGVARWDSRKLVMEENDISEVNSSSANVESVFESWRNCEWNDQVVPEPRLGAVEVQEVSHGSILGFLYDTLGSEARVRRSWPQVTGLQGTGLALTGCAL